VLRLLGIPALKSVCFHALFLLRTTAAFQTAIILEEAMSRELTVVNDLIRASELAALTDNPGVTLDVTNLDLGRLPQHVKAALYSKAATFNAPQLQMSGNIYADKATSFSVPQLRTSGFIDASSATSVDAPQLQTSGNIYASSATSFDAPQLRVSGNINAYSATSFDVPQLRISGNINVSSAATFDAPWLQKSEQIYARSAISFNAPQLQKSGNINAPVAPVRQLPRPMTRLDL
jgi:hypothetical protein